MQSHHQKLYNKLKELDLDNLKFNYSNKIEIPPNINKNMRFVGSEFERVFTSILDQKYGLSAKNIVIKIEKKIYLNNTIIDNTIIRFRKDPINQNRKLDLINYINNFNFFNNSSNILEEKKELEIFIKEQLFKINFDKFKPKKHIITKLKCCTSFDNNKYEGVSGEIDLIIDDKIIDIKTDSSLILKKDYLVQLLFYYFILNYSHRRFFLNSNTILGKLNINKLCLYYACFDVLIEFDIAKIFNNNKQLIIEIDDLIHNCLLNYNFEIRKTIHNVVFKKKINEDYFNISTNKSNENQLNLYKSFIDSTFSFYTEVDKKIDIKNDILLQLIKINLGLYEKIKSNTISKETYNFIIEYLMISFRNYYKKINKKRTNKSIEKHIFLSLKDFFKINNIKNYIDSQELSIIKNTIQKSHFEHQINCYTKKIIDIEQENFENFILFLKKWNSIYLLLYEQKLNNILNSIEFELLTDLIIDLLRYNIDNKIINDKNISFTIKILDRFKDDLNDKITDIRYYRKTREFFLSNCSKK